MDVLHSFFFSFFFISSSLFSFPSLPKLLRYPSMVYKVFNMGDGQPYAFRRIAGLRLTDHKAMAPVEAWKEVKHSTIVNLKEAFTTKDFGDSCE